MNAIFAIVTGVMFGLGVYLLLRRDLVKTAMGYYVLFTAINLFFLAVGVFDGTTAPYVGNEGQPSDPLVQALLLTAIVISFGTYALLLGMINVASRRYGTIDSDGLDELRK
ncbi:MAG: NADH-quinone oxidoreductase subunit K [Chloroflexi bacterium]|nr:NADH-quinone oxidoreductase subunit K [Chloroflexota bacterium]